MKYWFKRKRYGWGWVPCTWEGWLSTLGFVALFGATGVFLPPDQHPVAFFSAMTACTAGIIALCYAKGESPRWTWGDDDDKKQ